MRILRCETMSTKRIQIPDTTFDGGAMRTAFQCLVCVMAEDVGIRRCLLFIPAKGNIRSTTLEQVLGSKDSKILSDGKEVRLGEGALRLETIKTFRPYAPGDAVIAIYADQKMMDAIDSNRSLKAVICVPHLPEAVDDWKRTWNPILLGNTQEEVRLIGGRRGGAGLYDQTHQSRPPGAPPFRHRGGEGRFSHPACASTDGGPCEHTGLVHQARLACRRCR